MRWSSTWFIAGILSAATSKLKTSASSPKGDAGTGGVMSEVGPVMRGISHALTERSPEKSFVNNILSGARGMTIATGADPGWVRLISQNWDP